MSVPSDGLQKSFTAQEVDAWLLAATEKHAELQRQEAFADISDLIREAFEEVRVISASLREGSQGVRGESAELRTHSARLRERSITLMERMAQFAPPSPEEVQKAEREFLECFQNGHKQEEEDAKSELLVTQSSPLP